jgi:hypothetical protein
VGTGQPAPCCTVRLRREEARQPAADAVVRERIVAVGLHHGRIVREVVVVQPVAHAQVRRDARQHREQRLLHPLRPGSSPGDDSTSPSTGRTVRATRLAATSPPRLCPSSTSGTSRGCACAVVDHPPGRRPAAARSAGRRARRPIRRARGGRAPAPRSPIRAGIRPARRSGRRARRGRAPARPRRAPCVVGPAVGAGQRLAVRPWTATRAAAGALGILVAQAATGSQRRRGAPPARASGRSPRPRRPSALGVGHVQELVRAVRVAARAQHAADHHLRLREARR